MNGTTIVMVFDPNDPKRGEISVLFTVEEAVRMTEQLLESGLSADRIRVFDAVELQMRVVHRPVVSLHADSVEEYSPAESMETFEEVDEPVSLHALSDEGPLTRNGVRFSSLFRSDDVS